MHIDESGWKLFYPISGKDSSNGFIWVFVCTGIGLVLYVIRPGRSASVPGETEIESFLPHKLTDEMKEKLWVAGRSDPAGSGDEPAPEAAACPAATQRPGARQAA